MEANIIGRRREKEVLERLFGSNEPEFLAIYGRRRVGKTFLVSEYFKGRCPLFELTGEKDATLAEQLHNFTFAFRTNFPEVEIPRIRSWREAFQLLATTIDSKLSRQRVVLFFDELPWLTSRRSKFLTALDHFWNAWGNRRNLVLIVCGSAASWMISKLLHSKGGLYNRVTAQIRLLPFSLPEVETYLKHRSVNLGRKDIVELTMCLGGIPHYLRDVRRGESVAQTVDRLYFSPGGLLRGELDRLFASLFEGHERHVAVIRALAKKRQGITRKDLLHALGGHSGGGLTRVLKELEESAFIGRDICFGRKTQNALYRLIDEYSLFYLTWVERMRAESQGYWMSRHGSRAWQAWAGLAFEALCLKHVAQIRQGLGIAGVSTVRNSWHTHTETEGAQIDLVIDRADNCVNLCEMKFADRMFTINKAYAENLRRKVRLFRDTTHTRKNLFLTMVTTYGCQHNQHFEELIANELTMDTLFGSADS